MQCNTLLLIHVDTGLQELYLPLLVMGIQCDGCEKTLCRLIVHIFDKREYSCQNFFSVWSSFNGKQYVCKTCHLIQTFSINTSVPLLTEFDYITNIQ